MINRKTTYSIKLKTQLLLIYLFTILLPVILLSQAVIYISGQKIIDQKTQISQETSKQLNRNIRELLNRYIETSYRICYYDDALENYLSASKVYASVLDSMDAYNNYLKQLNYYGLYENNSEAFLKVYFLNQTLLQDSNTYYFADEKIQKSAPYQSAIRNDGALAWGYLNTSNRIFMSQAFRDKQGTLLGVVSIEILENKLFSLISEIDIHDKEIIICDNDALVISSNNRALVGTSVKNKKYFTQALTAKDGTFDIADNGNFKIILDRLHTKKGLPDWMILTRIPIDSMLSDANRIRNISLLVSSVCIAVSGFLFILFIDRITNRIKKLVFNMKEVKAGKFNTITTPKNMDEIGEVIDNFNLMVISLKKLIYENYEVNLQVKDIALKKREAELYALQTQINPHFLFNTLESIRMKLYNQGDGPEAQFMIFNLSKILRMSLNWHGEVITLDKEVEFVKYYLEINKARYKDKLDFAISIPEDLLYCKVLKLTLQPLVENAIKHGIEKQSRPGMIWIHASQAGEKLQICIRDNGAGISSEALMRIQAELSSSEIVKSEGSIGIKNVHDRIILTYGKEYGLTIQSIVDEGTEVTLLVPFIL